MNGFTQAKIGQFRIVTVGLDLFHAGSSPAVRIRKWSIPCGLH